MNTTAYAFFDDPLVEIYVCGSVLFFFRLFVFLGGCFGCRWGIFSLFVLCVFSHVVIRVC